MLRGLRYGLAHRRHLGTLSGKRWERTETVHWGKETEFDKTWQVYQPCVWRQTYSSLCTYTTECTRLKSSDWQGMALKPEKPVHPGPSRRHRNVPPIVYTSPTSEGAWKRPVSFPPGSSPQKGSSPQNFNKHKTLLFPLLCAPVHKDKIVEEGAP